MNRARQRSHHDFPGRRAGLLHDNTGRDLPRKGHARTGRRFLRVAFGAAGGKGQKGKDGKGTHGNLIGRGPQQRPRITAGRLPQPSAACQRATCSATRTGEVPP